MVKYCPKLIIINYSTKYYLIVAGVEKQAHTTTTSVVLLGNVGDTPYINKYLKKSFFRSEINILFKI